MYEGSREWQLSGSFLQPLHTMCIQLFYCELGPFIGLLVPWDSLVCWAPPDLDDDAGRASVNSQNAFAPGSYTSGRGQDLPTPYA
jgi:hypothetical protein